ncbi:hypothetical protein HPP92_025779 [Vanilla planifolia]|nr:hypothetical protein HPP92_025779 [Vanilla planifolia]
MAAFTETKIERWKVHSWGEILTIIYADVVASGIASPFSFDALTEEVPFLLLYYNLCKLSWWPSWHPLFLEINSTQEGLLLLCQSRRGFTLFNGGKARRRKKVPREAGHHNPPPGI